MLEYGYRVDRNGCIVGDGDGLWTPEGFIHLEGDPHSWLEPFDRAERDLLRVAAAVHDTDRLSRRRTRGARDLSRELAWQRKIRLQVAVEDLPRWMAQVQRLEKLLRFLTDDQWQLSFQDAGKGAPQQLPLLKEELGENPIVALFSGGLDSVVGLASNAPEHRTVVAVSACGTVVKSSSQRNALSAVEPLGIQARWIKFEHQLRGTAGKNGQDSSQRSRGFFFLSLAAAVASTLRSTEIFTYETGVGCINLPLTEAQVGAQATKSLHPRTLMEFEALLGQVLGKQMSVQVPFMLHTKAELCRRAGARLKDLATVAMSCDEGEGHKLDSMEHCGTCSSCLFRRIALHAALRSEDPTGYRARNATGYEFEAMDLQALRLSSASRSFVELLPLDPNLRSAIPFLARWGMSEEVAKEQLCDLYRRYSAEALAFFRAQRPSQVGSEDGRRKQGAS